jgi:hypothetical protein
MKGDANMSDFSVKRGGNRVAPGKKAGDADQNKSGPKLGAADGNSMKIGQDLLVRKPIQREPGMVYVNPFVHCWDDGTPKISRIVDGKMVLVVPKGKEEATEKATNVGKSGGAVQTPVAEKEKLSEKPVTRETTAAAEAFDGQGGEETLPAENLKRDEKRRQRQAAKARSLQSQTTDDIVVKSGAEKIEKGRSRRPGSSRGERRSGATKSQLTIFKDPAIN